MEGGNIFLKAGLHCRWFEHHWCRRSPNGDTFLSYQLPSWVLKEQALTNYCLLPCLSPGKGMASLRKRQVVRIRVLS